MSLQILVAIIPCSDIVTTLGFALNVKRGFPGAGRCRFVCVCKSDPATSKGSNAVRMMLLSPDPGANSNTPFLLKETRKERLVNVTAIPAHGTAHPHSPVREVWLRCGVGVLRGGTDMGCVSLNRLVREAGVVQCGRASFG